MDTIYARRIQKHEHTVTAGYLDYMRLIGIKLAVEVLTGHRHFPTTGYRGVKLSEKRYPLIMAARFLGAVGDNRQELVEDIARLLKLNGAWVGALISRVATKVTAPPEPQTATVTVTWLAIRHEFYEATVDIPGDLPADDIPKLLEAQEDAGTRKASYVERALGTWDVQIGA